MKNRFESSEIFTAYATVEAGYYMVEQIFKEIKKRTGFQMAIDSVTGYDKFLDKQLAEQLIPIVEGIIEAKKVIEMEFSEDEKLLAASKKALAIE